jgi:peptide/nickel transport system permease protein
MLPFIAKRLLSAFLTLLLVSVLTFSLAHLAGDPAVAVAGREASAEDVARIRAYYGFDRPLVEQYLSWSGRALVGDFGMSYHYQQSVSDMLARRLPITLSLGLSALIFALVLSLPLGILAAVRPNSIIDRLALLVALVGQAMPTFCALESDYIRTARAKGLRLGSILFKHALRNVLIPVVSVSAVQLGAMLGGSIVIEQIFAMQGIGWLGYDATVRSDLPVVQAITLIIASVYVLLTLLADLINAVLDPRIRVG